jgi:hypothetical protein
VLVVFPFLALAQGSAERSALANLKKGKWEKVRDQMMRSVKKDTINAAARYVLAVYFFSPTNPAFHLDSAYDHVQSALNDYRHAPEKARERMRKIPLDSMTIILLRTKIDSAAFERAQRLNTEQAYIAFLEKFITAEQRSLAISSRNTVAFQAAVAQGSYRAMEDFLRKYPDASQSSEAKRIYERLLFEARTSDGRLSSYQKFIEDHPESEYRLVAERNVLEIGTASGTISSYEEFITQYPRSPFAKRARDILYYLYHEIAPDTLPPVLTSDSLQHVVKLKEGYLVPYLKSGRFGFMDNHGREVIPPFTEDLDKAYVCGNIQEEVLAIGEKIISRDGAVLWQGEIDALDDLGFGFLLLQSGDCLQIFHKSGWMMSTGCIADAKIIGGRFVAVKKDSLWGLFTLTGRRLQTFQWTDISALKNIIRFQQGSQVRLARANDIGATANQQPLETEGPFDDAKLWPNGWIWVQHRNEQAIYDSLLYRKADSDNMVLTPAFFGAVGTSSSGISLFNVRGEESGNFKRIKVNESWVGVALDSGWQLFDPLQRRFISQPFDSVWLGGKFAVGYNTDSAHIFFNEFTTYTLPLPVRCQMIPGQDSVAFLWVEQQDKKSLFNHQGVRLLSLLADRVQYAGSEIFIVHKKEKKGLVNAQNKMLLPIEYDAIGTVSNNRYVSLLKNMKFGLYDLVTKKIIKPEYDKNLVPYNQNLIAAFKDGSYGFIKWDNKPSGKFEFSEIQRWNDTTALVRKDKTWSLYNLKNNTMALDQIREIKMIRDLPEERLMIVRQNNFYGVINSRSGIVIPLTFTDIVNVGSLEHPTYFTEKHVQEADLFVVIYYDEQGKMLRREVYEQDDYEKLYCND